MNSHQRRTVRRAKDARRPYGRAVERERRKRKASRNRIPAKTFICGDCGGLFMGRQGRFLTDGRIRCHACADTASMENVQVRDGEATIIE